jgi:hypothetical protein
MTHILTHDRKSGHVLHGYSIPKQHFNPTKQPQTDTKSRYFRTNGYSHAGGRWFEPISLHQKRTLMKQKSRLI